MADCETAFVVQGMQYTATSPLDAMNEEELSAMSAHDRRSLQKQYAHFWRKDSVYLRLLSNIGEGRIEYNRPNSQYYCGRHDFVYNFGTSDEPLQQITIVLPFAGCYQFDRLAVECQAGYRCGPCGEPWGRKPAECDPWHQQPGWRNHHHP